MIKLFCDKCGNSLPNEARFCDKCGNSVTTRVVTGYRKKLILNKGIGFYGSVITSLILIVLLLFQKCIKISALSYFVSEEKSSFSLFQIFNVIDKVGEIYSDAEPLVYIGVGALVVLVVSCIITYVVHIYQSIAKNDKSKLAIVASCMYIVVTIIVVLVLSLVNHTLEEESLGLLQDVLCLSGSVYFTIFISIVNIIFSALHINER